MSSTDSFSESIEAALNGEALLFTGAGFSYGAINVNGTSPKSGPELAKELATDCEIDEDTFLDEAAGFFMEDHGTDALIARIRPLYSISSVAEHHSILARIRWQRVYTTNYDNVYETACAQLPRVFQPLTLQHLPRDISFSGNDCIYLNGFIDDLNRQTIQSSFKLTRASYLTESLLENPWLQVFRGDLDIAQAVFFVGYSMYDLDIARLLFSTESLREKTFFVTSKTPSKKSRRSLEQFGTVAPIGVDGFAHMVTSTQASFTPKATNTPILASFDQAINHDPGTRPLQPSVQPKNCDCRNLLSLQ